MAESISYGILGLIDPAADTKFDIPQIIDGCFLEIPGFVLNIGGQSYIFDEGLQVCL